MGWPSAPLTPVTPGVDAQNSSSDLSRWAGSSGGLRSGRFPSSSARASWSARSASRRFMARAVSSTASDSSTEIIFQAFVWEWSGVTRKIAGEDESKAVILVLSQGKGTGSVGRGNEGPTS